MDETADEKTFRKAAEALAALKEPGRQSVVLRPMQAPVSDPPESRFGDRLKDARQQLGMSVEAFSRLCKAYDTHDGKGISPPTLGRYEANETLPGIRELRLIAQALAVPIQWLVSGDLPDVGGTAPVQAMVTALRDFVEYVQGDIRLGGARLSEYTNQSGDAWRAARMAEARKPSGES